MTPDTLARLQAARAAGQPIVLATRLPAGDQLLLPLDPAPEALLAADAHRALRRLLVDSSRPGTFSTADLARYRAAWEQPGALTAMLNWYRALRLRGRWRLPRIEPETLVIWGVEDRFLEGGLAEAAAARCRSARIDRRQATHWVQAEKADGVNDALLEFFRNALTA